MSSARIQELIHKMEMGGGTRFVWALAAIAAVVGMGVLYDLNAYHGFSSPEAMDAAQVARNVEEGHGFTTEFIRPFSIYLVQKHNHAANPAGGMSTNDLDFARLNGFHPDLANAPVYPLALAGLMKTWKAQWQVDIRKPFWSEGGNFQRYQPEFRIAIFNQLLLCVVVGLTFLISQKLFDREAAWLAAGLTLGSDLLWKFSVSGLSTMLLLVVFLGLAWRLIKADELGRAEKPGRYVLFFNAAIIGLLAGLGMLTRYSFGWLILPVMGFLAVFGGTHRKSLVLTAGLAFVVVVSPWIVRNYSVSGTFFGTAGYAFIEGTLKFAGTRLMQSLNPDFSDVRWLMPCIKKTLGNFRHLLENGLLTAWGWGGVLFFAGLLLGWRNVTARRLRYFTMVSLGVFGLAEALGKTQLSVISPDLNSENLLVLLLPLVNIFGAAFFLTLVAQIKTTVPAVRYAVIALVAGLACAPFGWSLFSKISPLEYPPYYPPEVQKICGWMRPDELMMSDVPWAVAWYGDRQCAWTTLNTQSEFFALNDYIKSVSGLYLTAQTLDAKLLSDCVSGPEDSWPKFIYKIYSAEDSQLPPGWPLKVTPPKIFPYGAGLFLTDRVRWQY